MTAEIALLNKLAVTLAADSAVTIGSGASTKVYNSADKIFEGTNLDPIGIMVYNSPELSGIPVESIIKMHRDRECKDHFSTVFDFADAFLDYLKNMPAPEVTVSSNIDDLSLNKCLAMRDVIKDATDTIFKDVGSGKRIVKPDRLLQEIESDQIMFMQSELQTLQEMPDCEWAVGLTVEEVLRNHKDTFDKLIDSVLEDVITFPSVREEMANVLAFSIIKEFDKSTLTGLVFAGFGKDEIFPSLVSYEVYGSVAGRLKHTRTQRFDVDRKLYPDAAIYPFAQQDMVDRFVYGLDFQFLDLCDRFLAGSLTELKVRLTELLGEGDIAVRDAIPEALDAILSEFNDNIVPGHLRRSREQLSDMVRSMPKQELAALSESLVHITSLKRKFSAGAESVGGPIDVAMITRAEGFVWVRRKHYFDAALNPRFFFRRYGGIGAGQGPRDADR